jgi:hypothetical protein
MGQPAPRRHFLLSKLRDAIGRSPEATISGCGQWVGSHPHIWGWVNTYRYIFSGMNIHKSQLFWGSLGTRVLTHPHISATKISGGQLGMYSWTHHAVPIIYCIYCNEREYHPSP